jgi:predicted enzyme related to lactoylglutathione lyase
VITGAHAIVYTHDADALRAFFRDVLDFPWVDAGHGWLVFALPPSELAAHPAEASAGHELYLLCDDVETTVRELTAKGAEFTGPVEEMDWGIVTAIRLPGGGELGLYEPKHPRPSG